MDWRRSLRIRALGFALLASIPAAPPARSQSVDEIERVFAAADAARRGIDLAHFDPDARADRIGNDIGAIFRFARDWIAYHPYRGIQRFAAGALMSRAGNACDKSLLLAQMLRRHGHKVRFARAELDTATAAALVSLSDRPATADSRSGLGGERRAALAATLRGAGFAETEIAEALREDEALSAEFASAWIAGIDFSADAVGTALARSGIRLAGSGAAATTERIAAARDHCWVQLLSAGDWIDLDPSAVRIRPGARLAEPRIVVDTLPDSLAFRLRVTVTAERLEGGRLERADILDHTHVLAGAISAFSLSFVPENAARSGLAMSDVAALKDFAVVWPILKIGETAAVGDPFDLAGRKLARDPRQRLGDAVGGGFKGALGGGRAMELRRVVLTLRIEGPGGHTESHERELIRRADGPRDRAEANLRLQLLGTLDLAVSSSRIDEAYLAEATLAQFGRMRPAWQHLARVDAGATKPGAFDAAALAARRDGRVLRFLFLRGQFLDARIAADAPGLIAFAATPQIVAYEARVKPGAADPPVLGEGYDIFTNGLAVYRDPAAAAGGLEPAQFLFQQGIADTVLEHLLMAGADTNSAFADTAAAWRRDGAAGLVAIRPGDVAALERANVPAGTKAAMREALGRGFAIILPLAPSGGHAWWRVHPESGATLGIGSGGRGQSFTERVLKEALVFQVHFTECFVIEGAVAAWKGSVDQLAEGMVVCMAFAAVMHFAGDAIWRTLGRLLDKLKAAASRGANRAAKWARDAFPRKPVYTPGSPPVPAPPAPAVGKGVPDAVKGAGPARPVPPVTSQTPTLPQPPPSMTPTRPGGPHGTEIVKVPWTLE